MFSFSIKQLLRQPGKTLLFFLLMVASTALVVTGAMLTIENNERINIVESTYTTIGMIEQPPIDWEQRQSKDSCSGTQTWSREIYGDPIMMDALDFPGANYIVKPEQRPVFVTYQPDMSYGWGGTLKRHLLEFTPLESTDGTEPVEVEVTRVIHSEMDARSISSRGDGSKDKKMEVGDTFLFTQKGNSVKTPLEMGEKYVCNMSLSGFCQVHNKTEYSTYTRPYTNQRDTQGRKMEDSVLPYIDGEVNRIDHVDGDDFYELGHMGDIYLKWAEIHKMEDHLFPVMGTSSLSALPSCHDLKFTVTSGREITPEEFSEGALVCMFPVESAKKNGLSVGDKVRLPLTCVEYSVLHNLAYDFSLLNAQGEFYDVFWNKEYEIVGLFTGETKEFDFTEGDVIEDMFIIPINSVGANWDDNIAGWSVPTKYQATFQIPNGTIQEFDAALKENVPEAERLNITYDDRGYSEIVRSLQNSRAMALLLLLAGVMAALSIMALLLYFFVVKEKKRTAVERSLGMTKRQCRVSLLSALMILTVLSACAGGVCGTLALDKVSGPQTVAETPEERDSLYDYDTRYSTWAANRELAEKADIQVDVPVYVSYAVPLGICLLVFIFALLLMAVSFRIDPIYLLSTREQE